MDIVILMAVVLSAISNNSDSNNTKEDTITSCTFQQVGTIYSDKATTNIKCSDNNGIRNTDEFPAKVTTNGNIVRLTFNDNLDSFDENITIDTLEEETNTTSTLQIYAIDGKSMETNIYSTTTQIRTSKKNILPVANAGEDKTMYLDESITIVGSGLDTDGEIISYHWAEEATTLSTLASFEYTPTSEGIHTITLTVKDNNDDEDTDEMSITVKTEGSDTGKSL